MSKSANQKQLNLIQAVVNLDEYNELMENFMQESIDSLKDERQKVIFKEISQFYNNQEEILSRSMNVLSMIAEGNPMGEIMRRNLTDRDFTINEDKDIPKQESDDFRSCINAHIDTNEAILEDKSLLSDELGEQTRSAYFSLLINKACKRLGGDDITKAKLQAFMYTQTCATEVNPNLYDLVMNAENEED